MNKKIIMLFLVLVFISTIVYSNEQLSFDGFESGTYSGGFGWEGDWINSGTVGIIGWSDPFEGNRHSWLRGSSSLSYRTVNTTGYSNIRLFVAVKINSFEGGDSASIIVSDGTTNITLRVWTPIDSNNTWNYYTFPINLNGILTIYFKGDMSDLGDEYHIDNVEVRGTLGVPEEVNIILQDNYVIGQTIPIYVSSTEENTLHTIKLTHNSNTFCEQNIMSPSVSNTMFEVTCTLPSTQSIDVEGLVYVTNNPSTNDTKYFNVLELSGNPNKLKIEQVYFSPQVLQGGSTEIFTVIKKTIDVNLSRLYVVITFPDGTQRRLSMERTINDNEYRAFITDTYRTGYTNFTIFTESETYNTQYSNQYYVVPFTVDYVANVGSVTSIEKPVVSTSAKIQVFGTEYVPNEPATVFLQLVNEQGLYINDGLCYINIYYPNLPNQTKPVLIQDGPMLHLNNSKGLYYYDLITPDTIGVYMATAGCSYSQSGRFVYDISGTETDYPNKTVTYGTFSGNEIFLNDYEDWIYTQCAGQNVAGTRICDSYYDFNTTLYFPSLTNITSADLYFMGEASSLGTITQLYYWNWNTSTWVLLPNSVSYTTWSSSPLGVGFYSGNSLPLTELINVDGIIRIRILTTSGSTMTVWYNWLNIKINTALGTVKELKGGSEIHISDLYDRLNTGVVNIPENVWNYTTRNLTYYEDVTNYTLINEGVWNYGNRNLTYYQNFNDYNLLSNFIWNRTNRNLTYYEDVVNYVEISNYVWNRTNRNLTYYSDVINYLLIQELVWNRTNRNLTYYPLANVNYNEVANYVWNRTNRNLTYYEINDYLLQAEYVWNRTHRNLTYYQNFNDFITASKYVWNETNRNLTYYPPTTDETNYLAIQEYVWNRTHRNLTFYEINDYIVTAEYVWNRTNRNLTYYQNFNDYNLLSNFIWNRTNRNLTYYEDIVNYNLIPIYVWNYTTRELTFFDYSLQSKYTWNNSIRNLTFYENFNDYPQIAEYVWNRTNRNLTYYEDVINYLLASKYIWNNTIRNLTFYEPINIDYSTNANYVWNYTNRSLSNNTLVAESVWNYNGNVSNSNVLQMLVTNVWEYVGRYIHGIIT